MSRNWSYLVNPFANATKESFRAMKNIGDFTYSALEKKIPPPSFVGGGSSGIPIPPNELALYVELHDELTPLINDYNTRYIAWLNASSDRKGQTTRMVDMFNELRGEKIQEWDATIQTIYKAKSAEYQRLLPRKRSPFQSGQYRTRLDALSNLATQIAGDTNFLLDFRTGINDFYEDLLREFNNQSGEKSDLGFASSNLEPARKALATGLFSALGAMIRFFAEDTNKITNFFDMEIIRDFEQTTFRHTVKPLEIMNAFKRTLSEDDVIRLQNDGATELKFWLAETSDAPPGTTHVTLQPNNEKAVSLTELGSTTGKYLNVKNTNEFTNGHYVISIG